MRTPRKKKPPKAPNFDVSSGEGQKRLMQESVGHEYAPPRRIDVTSTADYGADPLGPDEGGVFRWRMVPSGNIVDETELNRRLSRGIKRAHAVKKTPAQLQGEVEIILAQKAERDRPFKEMKAENDLLEQEVDAADAVLQAFPKGPSGGAREDVRLTPKFREANARFQRAFARLRAHNAIYVKRFDKELRAERDRRYGR